VSPFARGPIPFREAPDRGAGAISASGFHRPPCIETSVIASGLPSHAVMDSLSRRVASRECRPCDCPVTVLYEPSRREKMLRNDMIFGRDR
jgi:hypothetical protein